MKSDQPLWDEIIFINILLKFVCQNRNYLQISPKWHHFLIMQSVRYEEADVKCLRIWPKQVMMMFAFSSITIFPTRGFHTFQKICIIQMSKYIVGCGGVVQGIVLGSPCKVPLWLRLVCLLYTTWGQSRACGHNLKNIHQHVHTRMWDMNQLCGQDILRKWC